MEKNPTQVKSEADEAGYEYSDVTPEVEQRAAHTGEAVMQLAGVKLQESIDHTDAIVDKLESEGRDGPAAYYAEVADKTYIEGPDAFVNSATESLAENGSDDPNVDVAALRRVNEMHKEANAYKALRETGHSDLQANDPARLSAQMKRDQLRKRLETDQRVSDELKRARAA